MLAGCVLAAQMGLTQYTETIYDSQGLQPGDTATNQPMVNLGGEPIALETFWQEQPVLFVSGSYTCPVARRTLSLAAELAEHYQGQIEVVGVYVYEPHPKDDPSPYTGEEWVTLWNWLPGILHRQPRSMAERLPLADKLNALNESSLPMIVDNMENSYWHMAGQGPNHALLVDQGGEVIVKQGWFHKGNLIEEIDVFLNQTTVKTK